MTAHYTGPAITGLASFDCDLPSHDVVVVGDKDSSQYILVGALTANRSMTYLTVRKRSGRMREIIIEQPDIKPGEAPEQIMVKHGSDWRELLVEYANASAAAMGVKPILPKENLAGYCTWYYYYADVSEKNFLDNVDALAAHPELPYGHGIAQIDDGYQTFQGDWLDQDGSWPTPLEQIARETTAKGLIPGIWTMPMCASTASRVFREHPDWFVKGEDGEPLVFQGWSPEPNHLWLCIDPTLPAVREHLTNVFKTFWKWGFRYFKMDGLGFGLPQGIRHDPAATPVSAFRLAMKTIREAVPEAFLLGCCPPFMACMGYCDACRVSCDTARLWSPTLHEAPACSIRDAVHTSLGNWWKFDRWFRADPDTLMARQDNAFYTLGEARISVLSGILTGIAITSDNLATIAPERLELLKLAAAVRVKNARPFGCKPFEWPRTWEGTIDGKRAVAVINDTEEALVYTMDALGLKPGARELLQNAGTVGDHVRIESHDAMLFLAD